MRARLAAIALMVAAFGSSTGHAQPMQQRARDRLATLGVDVSTLTLVRETHAHGYTIVELARRVRGLELLGAPIVVRIRPDGVIDVVDVAPLPPITRWPVTMREADARRAMSMRVIASRPVAVVHDGGVVAAIELELVGERIADRARAWLGAESLEVLRIEPRVLDANGRVYANNPVTDATTSDLPLTSLTSTTNLVGSHVRVRSCDQLSSGCTTTTRATPDASGDYLFAPMPLAFDDAFAEVSAYYHAERVVSYFATAHGFTWTCMPGVPMDLVVNYTETPNRPYDDAQFVPASPPSCGYIVFGQGTTADYAYDGDVVYHEYAHAVTDRTSALGTISSGVVPTYQPLAINEGTSDYWAAAVQGDPDIAESIHGLEGLPGGGLRTIDNTLACPRDLVGEPHFDGRIWSGLGWNLRTILGQSRADAIWFTTMSTLSGGVTLTQATSTLLTTVGSEVAMGHVTSSEQAMVAAAASARGLADCTMFVPLDDGTMHTGYSGTALVTGSTAHGVAPIEYTLQIPRDVTDVAIAIDHPTITGLATVHFANGRPITATTTSVSSGFSVPIGHRGTASYRLVDGLAPCGTLYVAIETTDLAAGESLFDISATVHTSMQTLGCTPPDTGPIDAGGLDAGADAAMAPPPPHGCGCRVGLRSVHAPWLVLALAVGILRRRR